MYSIIGDFYMISFESVLDYVGGVVFIFMHLSKINYMFFFVILIRITYIRPVRDIHAILHFLRYLIPEWSSKKKLHQQ